MTWLIVSALCLVAGGLRYLDGAGAGELPWAAKIPGFVFNALIAGTTGLTAWVVSSNYSVSIIVGLNAAVCITLGQTKWESWKHQAIRGAWSGLLLIALLAYLVAPLPWQSALGIIGLYTLAYVVYFWTENGNGKTIHPPIGHWEQWCRWIQSVSICSAGLLL